LNWGSQLLAITNIIKIPLIKYFVNILYYRVIAVLRACLRNFPGSCFPPSFDKGLIDSKLQMLAINQEIGDNTIAVNNKNFFERMT
jgi:hypothetical protein